MKTIIPISEIAKSTVAKSHTTSTIVIDKYLISLFFG